MTHAQGQGADASVPGQRDGGAGGDRSPSRTKQVDQLVAAMAGSAALPRRNGELVFETPWQSRAFGIAVALKNVGAFEWNEFQQRLVEAIAAWEREERDLRSWSYYERWMSAFQELLIDKGICTEAELRATAEDVARSASEGEHH